MAREAEWQPYGLTFFPASGDTRSSLMSIGTSRSLHLHSNHKALALTYWFNLFYCSLLRFTHRSRLSRQLICIELHFSSNAPTKTKLRTAMNSRFCLAVDSWKLIAKKLFLFVFHLRFQCGSSRREKIRFGLLLELRDETLMNRFFSCRTGVQIRTWRKLSGERRTTQSQ